MSKIAAVSGTGITLLFLVSLWAKSFGFEKPRNQLSLRSKNAGS